MSALSSHSTGISSNHLSEETPVSASVASRFDTIDLLRGLSILGVMLLHVRNWLSTGKVEPGGSLPPWLRYDLFNQGGNGVSAFFAISGFLITFISIRRFGALETLRVSTFYRIRFARIAPLLLLLLLILGVLHWTGSPAFHIKPEQGSLAGALFAALTFQLNWYEAVHGFLPPAWTVLWSLSVEEMFYLFFPVVCVALLRQRWSRPLFFLVLGGLIVFGPFARTPWYSPNDLWLYQSYLGNLDNIALGCLFGLLTAHLDRQGLFVRARWPLLCQILGAALILFIVNWIWPKTFLGWPMKRALGRSGTDVTILGLGVCLIMLGSVLRRKRGSRWTAPLRWLGRYSYEIYLSHVFVVIAVISLFLTVRRGPLIAWVMASVLLSAALGCLLSRFFSEPANRLLRGAPVPAQLPENR
ncbi:MAG TPA: acyltransferase [Granulicella sp.]